MDNGRNGLRGRSGQHGQMTEWTGLALSVFISLELITALFLDFSYVVRFQEQLFVFF